MYRSCIQPLVALFAASLAAAAAPPAVGIVTAAGSFTLDGAKVTGNATLFEGSRIETGTASAQLQLKEGGRMQLGAESSGIVYRNHLVLERGSGRFEKYTVEAFQLRIEPASADISAEVAVRSCNAAVPGTLRVGALSGSVRVTSASGVLMTTLQAGRTIDFTTQAAGSAGNCAISGIAPGGSSTPTAPAGATGTGTAVGGLSPTVATAVVVAAGVAAGSAVALVKAEEQPAISPSTP